MVDARPFRFGSRRTRSNVSRNAPSIAASERATARACSEGAGDPPDRDQLTEPLAAAGKWGHRAARDAHAAEVIHHHPAHPAVSSARSELAR